MIKFFPVINWVAIGLYQINCEDCDKVYVGKTKQNLDIILKKSFRNIKYIQTENLQQVPTCHLKTNHTETW